MTESAPNDISDPVDNTARWIHFAIFLAVLMFVAAVGLIAYQWLVTTEPSTVLIIDGNHALSGAEVSVQGVDEKTPKTAVFGVGDRFSLPFYLEAGPYVVRITLNDQKIFEAEVSLLSKQGQRIDLTAWEPKLSTSTPTTAATNP